MFNVNVVRLLENLKFIKMQFLHKKNIKDKTHTYTNQSFYGDMTFVSSKQLSPAILDMCVLEVSKKPSGEGEIATNECVIKYEFKKRDAWEDDEELKD